MHRIRLGGLLLVAGLLAACGGGGAAAPASPSAAAPSTAASKPAAAPSTSAAAPAGASASAKPAASGAASAAGSAAAKPAASGMTKVTVGLLASVSDAGIFIAQDHGYFKDQGIELDTQRFQTLVDMVGPVGTGQIDIAAGAPAAGLYNAIGRDVPIKIVADKGSAPSPEWDFTGLVLRKDLIDSGKVKDYPDLKALRLVTSGKGNSPEVALAAALKKGGLTLKDIDFQQMSFPDMIPAIANKGIDGGIVIEPFLSSIVASGTGVAWKRNLDILGHNQQIAIITYGQKFYSNQDLARRWMVAYVKALRDYNDAFGPKKKGYDDVVNILAKYTTVKDKNVYSKMTPAGLNPDGKLDVKSMQEDVDYYVSAGYMKEPLDVSKLVDSSYQEYAVQQLGPYKPA
ncbi:MAG TPA: ABC transporter substrate-binding protein [Chloroflexota bacterium]|nr:ABC transporter substrate-binding protein [Chloroflexota bacterium]